MNRYSTQKKFSHQSPPKIGILVTNLGSPDAPTAKAIRPYLKTFLSDSRVIEIPKAIWWFILNIIILNLRPKKSAHAYAKIWTDAGSPLLSITQKQAQALQQMIKQKVPAIELTYGMRYGNPSIEGALQRLRDQGCEYLLILPLYPHYSGATVGSTFDAIANTLRQWRWVPDLRFINHYHDNDLFIKACVEHIQSFWNKHTKPDILLFSYHGLPKRNLLLGDPYHCQCHKTTRLISEQLHFPKESIMTSFQSRFGKAEWLQPYTDKTVETLGKNKTKHLQIFCPGFSADCLETLEEIAILNKSIFEEAGGQQFHYIPALNVQPNHIKALSELILNNIKPWIKQTERDIFLTKTLAKKLGAKT